ncbi:MAG: hypothetical protein ACTHQE_01120 [Thermomicrobiales bacterium]
MATKVTAQPRKVLIDTQHGATSGVSNITYEKDPDEELWLAYPGDPWDRPNLFQMIGTADADERGRFNVSVKPGELFQAGIFRKDWGPLSAEPDLIARVPVVGMELDPVPDAIITSMTEEHGGTFVNVSLDTAVPTRLLLAAVSRQEPVENDAHVLTMTKVEGTYERNDISPQPLTLEEPFQDSHMFQLKGLIPGRDYYAGVIVLDGSGRWDQRYIAFTLMQRKLTVKIDNLHVNDDGDGETVGEAQFWIRVQYPSDADGNHILQDFYRPTSNINSGDNYPLGFVHLGAPQVAGDDETGFWVHTWGSEDDGWKGDEHAASSAHLNMIEFPVGWDEQVEEEWWSTDAAPSEGDTFSYYIQGAWWVQYEQV